MRRCAPPSPSVNTAFSSVWGPRPFHSWKLRQTAIRGLLNSTRRTPPRPSIKLGLGSRLRPADRPVPGVTVSQRNLFIQTQETPNVDALKFSPGQRILPEGFPLTFLEYLNPRSTLAAPYPSPLASQLLNVDGVVSVFYGPEHITVTKDSQTNWAHVKPEILSLITEAVASGAELVNVNQAQRTSHGSDGGEQDSLLYREEDSEVVSMIKELMETRIRPAVQDDGGDIEFRGFENGNVLLKLRGACRTCDSSTVTLKNGIESMLMHYIEEVKGVVQVLDPEEETAMQEFAKFEEKLKHQREKSASPTTEH